jgi:SnoaL-like domain
MDERTVAAWLDGYSRAWERNDPAEIGGLFSEDAVYHDNPFDEPARGREAIVANGTSRYFHADGSLDKEYDNVFLLRFDAAGRCAEYREWYMRRPDASG